MAFLHRSPQLFTYMKFKKRISDFKLLKYASHLSVQGCFSNNVPSSSHNYSTITMHRPLLKANNKAMLAALYLNLHRNLSTDDIPKGLPSNPLIDQPSISSATAETGMSKVMFIETSSIPETIVDVASPFAHETVPMADAASSQEAVPLAESTDIFADMATSNLVTDMPSVLSELAEPTLSSLGLCNYTPVGLVQAFLEFLHVNMNMPWWASIVLATVIARTLLFPVFVKTQKNTAVMSQYMPKMQFLQAKFGEARRTGNSYEASKAANELMEFMKEHNVSPFKTMLVPMMQAPVFISYFLSLRSMAKLPVESLKTGGFSWVTDLTIPDPYYLLPMIASSTLYVILKVGAESGVRMEHMKMGKYLMIGLPLIVFPFCINFPSAVLVYWCTNNLLTLGMVSLIKINSVREFFKIPKKLPPDPKYVMPKKNFMDGFRESIDDQKVLKVLEERKSLDEVQFKKSGTGPIPRTYKYDPTKPRPASAAAAAARKSS